MQSIHHFRTSTRKNKNGSSVSSPKAECSYLCSPSLQRINQHSNDATDIFPPSRWNVSDMHLTRPTRQIYAGPTVCLIVCHLCVMLWVAIQWNRRSVMRSGNKARKRHFPSFSLILFLVTYYVEMWRAEEYGLLIGWLHWGRLGMNLVLNQAGDTDGPPDYGQMAVKGGRVGWGCVWPQIECQSWVFAASQLNEVQALNSCVYLMLPMTAAILTDWDLWRCLSRRLSFDLRGIRQVCGWLHSGQLLDGHH